MKFKEHDVLLTDNELIILVLGVTSNTYLVSIDPHVYHIVLVHNTVLEKHCVKIGVL